MSEAIDDMRAFTELTDAIFYHIKYSREKELQEVVGYYIIMVLK